MSTIFPPKHVGATQLVHFDFLSWLVPGETITGASVVSNVFSGIDPLPANLLTGISAVAGPIVSQGVTGGVVGVVYSLACTITTSLGATKIMRCYLAVIDSNPFEPV